MIQQNRSIKFHGKHFMDFYWKQSQKTQAKIEHVLSLVKSVQRIPRKFLEHIHDHHGLYEIRVESNGGIYRIFCCFETENKIVLFNGFQKKTKKTPQHELEKACRLLREFKQSQTK